MGVGLGALIVGLGLGRVGSKRVSNTFIIKREGTLGLNTFYDDVFYDDTFYDDTSYDGCWL